ncbi:UDP-glycosyltransferase UGT5-like [Condylostylus longicornis]|uniref:UDP-glycosyltransferase UGT5-like n=1 Tax=Condylostylus longicornis TaxID=2530218 RepID=UPI00244DE527|nr:UDP-glycosyltransferase UGT5-like [Condylostylus longicornis]
MCIRIISLIFVLLLWYVPVGQSAKILGLFTSQSKSHVIIHMSVARALIENGHNLTIVTTIDLNESNKNFRHIKVPGENVENMINNVTQMSTIEKFIKFFYMFRKLMGNSIVALKSTEMQKLMKEESFDLIIIGYFLNEYEIGVAAHFKCPAVIIFMGQPIYSLNNLVGNPDEITHIPHPIWGETTKYMGFFSRVANAFWYFVDNLLWWTIRTSFNTYYKELFPPEKYPSYEEALKNVSLILSNYHFSQGPIRADVPAVIQIGGIQIEENPKKLPEKIQKHLDSAGKDGAIFFSLGSNVRSADLGANASTAIYNVLSSLKQKVVWKWETDDLPGKSQNILFEKWLPQNSVLAHPNLKLFITHGGRGSVVESEYFGVPMIGLPVFGDQSANVDQLVEAGYGLRLDHSVLTEENLRDAINKILTDSKYSENIKRFRDLFRDRPMTPKESAVYWVNYVLRHKGAKNMQSAAVHMPFYQLMGLDVLAFIGILLYVWLKLSIFTCKLLWRASCYVLCCKCFRKFLKGRGEGHLKAKNE